MNTPFINNNIIRIMYYYPSGLIVFGLCFTIIVAKIKYALSSYNLSNTRDDIKKINHSKKTTNDKYSNIELVQMMKLYNMEKKKIEEIFLDDDENGPIWF